MKLLSFLMLCLINQVNYGSYFQSQNISVSNTLNQACALRYCYPDYGFRGGHNVMAATLHLEPHESSRISVYYAHERSLLFLFIGKKAGKAKAGIRIEVPKGGHVNTADYI